ncbi:hypothetical protein GCM10009665_12900 [Kitasatospora nipponensis]|uniref:Uncharacterized protein n=1 Tax=Kitasatospora nipponensis TaxID=258049 RepID=A0ABP4GFW9_9ACTN
MNESWTATVRGAVVITVADPSGSGGAGTRLDAREGAVVTGAAELFSGAAHRGGDGDLAGGVIVVASRNLRA